MAEPVAVEQREKLHANQKKLATVLEQAGKDLDFSRKTVLDELGAKDADEAVEKFQALNKETESLGREIQREELKASAREVRQREEDIRNPALPAVHHESGDITKKSLGERFVATREFKESRRTQMSMPVEIDISIKTLFQTSAGFPPESIRTGRVVEAVARPIQVLDLIPSGPITQAVEKYMLQTTRTHSAAERAEGAAAAESSFEYQEQTSTVRSVGDSIPVTDEQLDDEPQVSGLLDQQLRFGVMQRIDGQVLVGNGTPPNLRGINNVVGIQTQAKGTESAIVAFLRALTKIRITGRAMPNAAVFHPNDWTDIVLTQDAEGRFLFGNPFQGPGPNSLFGIPVAQSDAQTENTGLVGDFLNFCKLSERKGVTVMIGFVGTQFTEFKRTLRADARVAFTVYRPAAFCQISGI